LAHKAEHAVDLETGAIVSVTLQPANRGDCDSLDETLGRAMLDLGTVAADEKAGERLSDDLLAETVTDKGYHSNRTLREQRELGIRTYCSEPNRGRRHWKGKSAERDAVYANRRRIRGARGRRLLRRRGERLERPNAHLYETGRLRRVHLRGHPNILKRVLVHVCGFNLGLLMRQLTGVGTPRSLQGRAAALFGVLIGLLTEWWGRVRPAWAPELPDPPNSSSGEPAIRQHGHVILDSRIGPSVAVGTTVTRRPPHRSVRAGLLHTAPTSDAWRQIARWDADAGFWRSGATDRPA